jgi:hypothetical protein
VSKLSYYLKKHIAVECTESEDQENEYAEEVQNREEEVGEQTVEEMASGRRQRRQQS